VQQSRGGARGRRGAGTWRGAVLEVPGSRQQVTEDLPGSLRKISNQASMSHYDALTSARIAATSAGTGTLPLGGAGDTDVMDPATRLGLSGGLRSLESEPCPTPIT